MLIAVLNKSTLVSNDDVATMTRVCAKQIRYHTSPAWEKHAAAVIYYDSDKAIPSGAHTIAVMDDTQQHSDLGWHTEANPGVIFGRVFARPVLDAGGNTLGKPLSVASVLSHEVQEMFVDPNINLWADDFGGRVLALEVCDPVEAQSYDLDGVTVSNFVYPAWFDAQADPGSQFDHLKWITKPFELGANSYVVYESEGKPHQHFAEQYPEWRKAMKRSSLSRTARRMQRAAPREAEASRS